VIDTTEREDPFADSLELAALRLVPLADLECVHGSLPGDPAPQCDCHTRYDDSALSKHITEGNSKP
jgi:hypothetical protein